MLYVSKFSFFSKSANFTLFFFWFKAILARQPINIRKQVNQWILPLYCFNPFNLFMLQHICYADVATYSEPPSDRGCWVLDNSGHKHERGLYIIHITTWTCSTPYPLLYLLYCKSSFRFSSGSLEPYAFLSSYYTVIARSIVQKKIYQHWIPVENDKNDITRRAERVELWSKEVFEAWLCK